MDDSVLDALLCKHIELVLGIVEKIVWLPSKQPNNLKKNQLSKEQLFAIYKKFDMNVDDNRLNKCLSIMFDDLYCYE